MSLTIREAVPTDVPAILRLVRALAEYEREPDAVEATEQDFAEALFPGDGAPTTHALIAEQDGQAIGLAVWFVTFSTWTGRNGIWLEDLFVDPAARGVGAGTALLRRLAEICVERDWRRLEWCVLTWNEPSIAFYRSLGSVPKSEWETHRIDGDALVSLASGVARSPGPVEAGHDPAPR
ncbi:N-acetyltransferase family protein [Nocardioides sp. DS6]|uniref:N-acetyltransferase family protein n=1 Tax=Nocardioides eburneus TaxID=3231482 RepID=A0ABV3T2U0_9ACTN